VNAVLFLKNYEPGPEPKSNGPDPRVVTEDVARLIKKMVRPEDDEAGTSVSLIAEKAETSTRTVYRVISQSSPTLQLDLADRLCIAVNSHLAACSLVINGEIVPYVDGEFAEIMAT
jgi:hypothetical protein